MIYDLDTHKDKLFNPLYYKLRKTKTRFVINYGGAGSGKSYSQHQLELELQLKPTCNFDTLVIRKHGTDIYDSSYKLFESIAKKYGCYHEFDWVFSNAKRQITNKSTGHRIIFKGIDEPEKLKSIVGIKRIVYEEANQGEFDDFLELNRRARGIDGIQIFLLLNPININHWIKKEIIDSPVYSPDLTVIKTTHHDNKFLKPVDHQQLENLKEIDYNQYRVYCLGEWGIDDPEKLFAKDYNESIHFGKTFTELYNKRSDVFLSFDFNITNTCLAIQNDIDKINVLREYHIKGYDLTMLCQILQKDFVGHTLFINGDASGSAHSALTRGNESAYQIIQACLNLSFEYHFYVPKANPSHLNSRLLTNIIFKFCEVNVSNECPELNIDLLSVEVDVNGSMEPYKKKNPARTHHLDPLRYHFNAHHSNKLKELGVK